MKLFPISYRPPTIISYTQSFVLSNAKLVAMSKVVHKSVSIVMIPNYSQQEFDSAKYSDKLSLICLACRSPFLAIKKFITHELKTNKGKLTYCCRKCIGKDIKPLIKINCKQCNKVVTRTSLCKKTKNIFCSQSCSAIFNMERKFGKSHKTNCNTCKKDLIISPRVYFAKLNKDIFYCSSACIPRKLKPAKIPKVSFCNYPRIPCIINTAIKQNMNCQQCNQTFLSKECRKTKHGKRFCSKSCRMKYFNIHHHVHSKVNTSYPENYLFSLLTAEFPNLDIQKNNRTFLRCGLEIDILIPSIKLAIEINGPVHYKPIFGEDRLLKVQRKDKTKTKELQSRQIDLVVLDVSELSKLHDQQRFIEKSFNELKELIISKPAMPSDNHT